MLSITFTVSSEQMSASPWHDKDPLGPWGPSTLTLAFVAFSSGCTGEPFGGGVHGRLGGPPGQMGD